jgi:sugar lactone lactonase YvrE
MVTMRTFLALALAVLPLTAAVSLSAPSATVAAAAGTGTFALTVTPSAAWTATGTASWLTVSPTSGSASATITYSFSANTTVNARSAAIQIAGRVFSVLQIGNTGNYTPWGTSGNSLVRTIAGTGIYGFSGDDAAATAANISHPSSTAVDLNGNVFFMDSGNRIRRVSAVTGFISTVAGSGICCYSGDGGPATSAQIYPSAIAVDASGNLYIAEGGSSRVRRVDATTGVITTVVGTGISGFSGDNGPATAARIYGPNALTLDSVGNLYVSDSLRVRRIDATTGVITTFAGNGVSGNSGDGGAATSASFSSVSGLTSDAAGNIYLSDSFNARVRRVAAGTGIMSTVAGGGSGYDGSLATQASLSSPASIATDGAGNLFILDSYRVRRVDAATGVISAATGAGCCSFSGDGGPVLQAYFYQPTGIALDTAGNLYVGDYYNNRLRFVDFSTPQVVFSPRSVSKSSAAGSDSVSLTVTPAGSSWVVATSASWLTPAATTGAGSGTLSYSFTANNSITPRVATLSLYGQILTVNQAGALATLSPSGATASPAVGSGTVSLTLTPAVPWTASSSATWLTVIPASGSAGTALTYSWTANAGAQARTATLTIAGKTFTVLQIGASGAYTAWNSPGAGQIRTIAGNGNSGYGTDGVAATQTPVSPVTSIVDANGNLYIADFNNQRVRRVDAVSGLITTVAGNGNCCSTTDGVAATATSLYYPLGLALDSAGNLFISEPNGNRVRRVDATTGIITTVAGNGSNNFSGDGGPAVNAALNSPQALLVDSVGNLLIADNGNNRVRRVDIGGTISTIAGNGLSAFAGDGGSALSASLSSPGGFALDAAGNLFIVDANNYRIRKIDQTTGNISTVAGLGCCGSNGDGGLATAATLSPRGIAIDSVGNLYTGDGSYRVRRIDGSTGIITTVAGSNCCSSTGDGGPAITATFGQLSNLSGDANGNLYLVDGNRIRLIDNATPRVTFTAATAPAVVGASTGSLSFTITPTGSLWVASSSAAWLTPATVNGTGSSTISYTVAANNSPFSRTGLIAVLGQNFTVIQAGAVATLTPATALAAATAGSGSLTLGLTPSVPWTAQSSASWLTAAPAGGSAGGTLSYSYTANTSTVSRTASLTVAGQKFYLLQIGTAGAYTQWGSSLYGQIKTIAGNGTNGVSGDGGAAVSASVSPLAVSVDSNGNAYIADNSNSQVRLVDAATGKISTIAGTGAPGFTGDGGPANTSQLTYPTAVVIDTAGNVVICDTGNNRIRRVSAADGTISTIAGNGVNGYSGDGGAATQAALNSPRGIVFDAAGNLFIADSDNSRIRRVDAQTGIITTIAGTGSAGFSGDLGVALAARLFAPGALAIDAAGNLFIADRNNYRIRRIDAATGIITTAAGNGCCGGGADGLPASTTSIGAYGIAVDSAGNLFVTDNYRIRRVDAVTKLVSAVAGSGNCCYGGDGGPAITALMQPTGGIALDSFGGLYITDSGRLRYVDLVTPRATFVSAGVSVPVTAGSGSVNMTIVPAAAVWTAASNAAWLTVTSTTGTGSGPVGFSFTANNSVTPRTGLISVYGQAFSVRQSGAAVSLAPTSAVLSPSAGTATFALSMVPSVPWTALSSAAWLTVSPGSGSANATLTYTWTANSSANARQAVIVVAGQSFPVAQSGASGSFSPFGTPGLGIIQTVAGSVNSDPGDGGAATAAALNVPLAVAADSNSNLFIADYGFGRIRRVDSQTGLISTIAGIGVNNFSGDGGNATAAALAGPVGVAVDTAGNVFLAELTSNRVRRVDAVTGKISTVVGNGSSTASGDYGLATAAGISPRALALDPAGNLFIAEPAAVRRVDNATGIITTVAGSFVTGFSGDGGQATAARLSAAALALDSAGNIFIADTTNNRIRRVDALTGIITSVAGNGCCGSSGDGGPATTALLSNPVGIVVDRAGNLYISDTSNFRIRRVDAATGIISTVAGTGVAGFSGDGGPALLARLQTPQGLALDGGGNLYFPDANRIRSIDLTSPAVVLSSSSAAVAAVAGSGTFSFTIAPATAAWSALSNVPWLTLSPASGTGNGSPTFNFAANNSLSARTGVISVLGQPFTITQAPAAASLAVSSLSVPATAGTGTLTLSLTPAAPWTSASSASWLTVSPATGTAGGAVTYTYLANSTPVARAAILTIAGRSVIVIQLGTTGAYTPWGTTSGGGQIRTIAGTGTSGFSGDGGPALSARIMGAGAVAVDVSGNVYIADPVDKRVRKVNPVTGVISTVAGNGTFGSSGDGGPGFSAQLGNIAGIAVDAVGNFFISDPSAARIRRVDAATGIISTIAGGGVSCCNYNDGIPAYTATLNQPASLALDAAGNLFFAESQGLRVRRIDATTGIVTTVAGNGSYSAILVDGGLARETPLYFPQNIAVDRVGNLFIADNQNRRVRRVDAVTGIIASLAGNGSYASGGDGGSATSASFISVGSLAVDFAGNVYVVDNTRIRRVDASTGIITSVTVSSTQGYAGDGGPALQAVFANSSITLATDVSGNVYVGDTSNLRVRFIDFSTPVVTLSSQSAALPVAAGSSTVTFTISPAGSAWVASSSAAWLTLGASRGAGDGTLSFTFTSNNALGSRTGVISVLGQNFTVLQAGSTVAFSLPAVAVKPTAGTGTVGLTVTPAAAWTAISSAAWLTVSPASGLAGATLTYSFTANTGSGLRTGLISVGGRNFAVTQIGTATNYNNWGSNTWGSIRSIAGTGVSGFSGDGGAATVAQIGNPGGIALDPAGNLYFADPSNYRIRRVDPTTGVITTFAGTGVCCNAGDDGVTALNAQLYAPTGLTFDAVGNLYFADGYSRIRRVDAVTSIITTVAGSAAGAGFSGDGGPATAARLSNPTGMYSDPTGNLYIADAGNHRIRRIDAFTGLISTIAGIGTSGFSGDNGPALAARLNSPQAVFVDPAGNVFVADTSNSRIRRIDAATGLITTVAGNGNVSPAVDGILASLTALSQPRGLTGDAAGNLYISDSSNYAIRRVDAVTGLLTTVAGSSCCSSTGDGGPAISARLYSPGALAIDYSGNLYVSETSGYRIRFIDFSTPQATLSPATASTGITAGTGSVALTVNPANSVWLAASSASWLTLTNPSGAGNTAIGYTFTANNSVTPRSAVITVFGQTAVVTQAGAAATLSTAFTSVPATAGTGSVTLTVTPAAPWTATSSSPWLTVTPSSGTAGATLNYTFTANAGSGARVATITAAGKTFTLLQIGSGNIWTAWGTTGYGLIRTIAGTGSFGNSGDNGQALAALFSGPAAIATDALGNLYLADRNNHVVRRVDASTGVITTIAGTGSGGFSGDGGLATSAQLFAPLALAFDAAGNLFIADNQNQRIRRVAAATGIITTVAGTGQQGFSDGYPAAAAPLSNPAAIALDPQGNLFIGDGNNNRIRRVDAASGYISTIAGTGIAGSAGDGGPATSATVGAVSGIVADPAGNVFFTDTGNSRVRRIDSTTGIVSTYAGNGLGSDGGPAVTAALSNPRALALDAAGNLFIGSPNTVRRVDAVSGIINTIAGSGNPGFSGDGGPATAASLNSPQGLAIDPSGNLLIAETTNNRVRLVDFATPRVTLSNANFFASAAAGTGTVAFTIAPAAAWTTISSAPWLTVTTAGGTGNGALAFSFTANNSVNSRSAVVTIYGQNLVVTQAGVQVTLSGFTASTGAAAGTGSVSLTLAPVAPWTASSSASWLTLNPTSGTANGNIGYSFTANTAAKARWATITIAGRTLILLQTGTGGAFTPWGTTFKGQIQTIAGTGSAGFSGDSAAATAAELNSPAATAVDGNGNLFIADTTNHRVRRVDVASGMITTYIGSTPGFSGDLGPASAAQLSGPRDLAFDFAGNLFISDAGNSRIRRVDAVTGNISTVAGGGSGGDGGPALSARISPWSVAVDLAGNLYVSEPSSNRIRFVNSATGVIVTLAGGVATGGFAGDNGPAILAQLNTPRGLAVDNLGNVFIADYNNNRVRMVDPATGFISTVAGNGTSGVSGDGATATSAQLNLPNDVAVDPAGNLYVVDSLNQKIRKVSGGLITTLAGTGALGSAGDGGLAPSAQLNSPAAVSVDNFGNAYITESLHRIRFVDSVSPVPVTPPGGGGGGGGGTLPPSSSTLTTSPAILIFTATPTSATLSQSIMLANSGSVLAYTSSVVTTAGFGWLSVSPDSGSTGTNVSIQVNPAGLAQGTYSGIVNFQAGTQLASVAVTLNVTAQLTVSPQSLSFTWSQGDPNLPAAKSLSVFSNPSGSSYTASAATATGGSWLSVSGAAGNTPGAFPVSVAPGSLSAGTYSGSVTVSAPGAGSTSVPVTLTVKSPIPALSVTPAVQNLTANAGGPALSGQITVSNTGGGTLRFSAQTNSDDGWLTVAANGTGSATASAPASLVFTADPSKTTAGLHSGAIMIRDTDSGAQSTVNLTFAVTKSTQSLQLSQSGLSFGAVAGGLAPPGQSFSISATGTDPVSWAAQTQVLSPAGGNWLRIASATGSPISVTVNPAGLAPGQYYGAVNITAPGVANSPQSVSVQLSVAPAGQTGSGVSISTGGLIFIGAAGSKTLQTQQVSVFSPSATPVAFTTTSAAAWLATSPASGTLLSGLNTVTLQVDFSSLAPGAQTTTAAIALSDGTVFNVQVQVLATGPAPGAAPAPQAFTLEPRATASYCTGGVPSAFLAVFRQPSDQSTLRAAVSSTLQTLIVDGCGNPLSSKSGATAQVLIGGNSALDLRDIGNGVWETTWTPLAAAQQVGLQIAVSRQGSGLAPLSPGITVAVQAALAGSAAQPGGIVNAAAGAQAPLQVVSPGSYVAIYGTGLSGDGAVVATAAPFPTTLNGTQIFLGDKPLPLYYASGAQVNALIPQNLNSNTTYQLVVVRGGTRSAPVAVTVAEALPGIYTQNASGTGQGAIQIAGTTLLAAPAGANARPVARGREILAVFATGLGPVRGPSGEAPPPDGSQASATTIFRTTWKVTATIGGLDAPVLFSGLTPTLVSLYQVNVGVPDGSPTGDDVPLVISVTDPATGQVLASNKVTIAIR